jgi:hypothetical protein
MGDNQTEFLHFSSCNSLDDDYMPTLWRLFEDPDSALNGRRLHQATGFHVEPRSFRSTSARFSPRRGTVEGQSSGPHHLANAQEFPLGRFHGRSSIGPR